MMFERVEGGKGREKKGGGREGFCELIDDQDFEFQTKPNRTEGFRTNSSYLPFTF